MEIILTRNGRWHDRYYRITVQGTLFDGYDVIRTWGGHGNRPTGKMLHNFKSSEEAVAFARKIGTKKAGDGYVQTS